MAMGVRPPCDSGMRLSKACNEASSKDGGDDDEEEDEEDDDDDDDDDEGDDDDAEERATAPAICLNTTGASK